MVNASFVFGMDEDDESVFDRTVAWAIAQGIETATFHILTPYPDTALSKRTAAQGRLLHSDWDLYDTRHVVYRLAKLAPETLEAGYWKKLEPMWDAIIRARRASDMLPVLETVLAAFGADRPNATRPAAATPAALPTYDEPAPDVA